MSKNHDIYKMSERLFVTSMTAAALGVLCLKPQTAKADSVPRDQTVVNRENAGAGQTNNGDDGSVNGNEQTNTSTVDSDDNQVPSDNASLDSTSGNTNVATNDLSEDSSDNTSLTGQGITADNVKNKDKISARKLTKSAKSQTFDWGNIKVSCDVNDDDTAVITIPGNSNSEPFQFDESLTNALMRAYGNVPPKVTKIVITGPLKIKGSAAYMFDGLYNETSYDKLENVTEIDGLENLDTSEVTDMSHMFNFLTSLKSINLSNFDTSKVKSMEGMFEGCRSLENIELGNFDTKEVTNMASMFAFCDKLQSLDLSYFETQSVTDMNQMFYKCQSLGSINFNSNNFITKNVTNMSHMFEECISLTNLDTSNFDTSNTIDMSFMFLNCEQLPKIDVSSFNTEKVQNMKRMFYNCQKVTELDVSHFNTDKVTDMSDLFNKCYSIKSLDLRNFSMNSCKEDSKHAGMLSDLFNLDTLKLGNKNFTLQRTNLYLYNKDDDFIWINMGEANNLPKRLIQWSSSKLENCYNPQYDYDTYKRISTENACSVHYVDDKGNSFKSFDHVEYGEEKDEIDPPKSITGYTLSAIKVDGETYTKDLDKVRPTFTKEKRDITFVYTTNKQPDDPSTPVKPDTPVTPNQPNTPDHQRVQAGNVTVHYQDESGNTVASDDVMTGYVGDGYVTSAKSITGYVLKTRPTNATGFFNNFPQSVTYVYSDRSSITENIGASSDPNTPTSSNTSNVNRPSKAPKYPIYNVSTSSVEPEHINFRPASKDPSVNENNSKALPQTGNNKTEKTSLFGLGLLAILSSLTSGWFTHKRKEN